MRFLFAMVLSVLAGCASDGRVSAREFRELLALPDQGTAKYVECQGVRDGRATLVVHEMSVFSSRWTQSTAWIPESELTSTLRERVMQCTSAPDRTAKPS
jgi:hypothetical protein